MEYLDFDIEIGPGSGRIFPINLLSSPAGEAHETFQFPYDTLELDVVMKALQIALLRSGGQRRKTLYPDEQSVVDFGKSLFEALFTGEIRSRYDVSQGEADRQGAGLRLKLRIQSPELAALPWEYLYDPREAEFICFSRNRPVVRYIDLPRPVKPLRVDPPLQILGMIVSPNDLTPLNVAREKKRVEGALQDFQNQGWVKLTWLEGNTWRDLQRALQLGNWHVFHFIGHGGFDPKTDEGLVALADQKGLSDLKSATQMGRLLADHHSLRLAVLNACEGARGSESDIFSSTASILVRKGIPAVVAMQYEITDRAAIIFARGFYEALVNGMPVDAAVAEARKAISLAINNTIEWGTPVLYLRAPNGVIFDMARVEAPEPSLPPSKQPVDPAGEVRVRELYNQANSAFWLEEWEKAAGLFQSILELHPGYRDVQSKLDQSRRKIRLAELDQRARTAQEASDWPEALRSLETILAEFPGEKDAARRLEGVRTRKQVEDLYTQARGMAETGGWQAVLNVLARIEELDESFRDSEGLRPLAERELAAIETQQRLMRLHESALAAMDAGDWERARQDLHEILKVDPDHKDAGRLLARVETEQIPSVTTAPGRVEEGEPPEAREVAGERTHPPRSAGRSMLDGTPSYPNALRGVRTAEQSLRNTLQGLADQQGLALFGAWVAFNTLGWLLAWSLMDASKEPVFELIAYIPIEEIWVFRGLLLLVGLIFAISQALVVRRQPLAARGWGIATLAAWFVGIFLTERVFPPMVEGLQSEYLGRVLGSAFGGTYIGFGQWLVLRDRFPSAGWWIVANTLAWTLVGLLNGWVFDIYVDTPATFLAGGIVGVTTGVALIWLSRRTQL